LATSGSATRPARSDRFARRGAFTAEKTNGTPGGCSEEAHQSPKVPPSYDQANYKDARAKQLVPPQVHEKEDHKTETSRRQCDERADHEPFGEGQEDQQDLHPVMIARIIAICTRCCSDSGCAGGPGASAGRRCPLKVKGKVKGIGCGKMMSGVCLIAPDGWEDVFQQVDGGEKSRSRQYRRSASRGPSTQHRRRCARRNRRVRLHTSKRSPPTARKVPATARPYEPK